MRDLIPINLWIPELLPFAVTSTDRRMARNTKRLKALLLRFCEDRASGKQKAFTEGSDDLIGILLENEFYRGNMPLIVDEIITFFLAGMKTVQITTTNLIMYLDNLPEIKQKLLHEILPAVEAVKDDIVEKLEYETVMDFEYLHKVFYETLRIETPLQFSNPWTTTEDITFKNGFTIKKGDMF